VGGGGSRARHDTTSQRPIPPLLTGLHHNGPASVAGWRACGDAGGGERTRADTPRWGTSWGQDGVRGGNDKWRAQRSRRGRSTFRKEAHLRPAADATLLIRSRLGCEMGWVWTGGQGWWQTRGLQPREEGSTELELGRQHALTCGYPRGWQRSDGDRVAWAG